MLGQLVREERLLTLEEGVRRMTSLPLSRLGIADRGIIREGMWADLVVFDPQRIAMRGPDPDPQRPETCWPVGISHVLVNGEVALEGHRATGVRAGRVLRPRRLRPGGDGRGADRLGRDHQLPRPMPTAPSAPCCARWARFLAGQDPAGSRPSGTIFRA